MEDLENLADVPVEELFVESKALNPQSVIGTPEFGKALYEILATGKSIWRTSSTLAQKLGVDAKGLDEFLRIQKNVASRPGKEEGVFLYALTKRLPMEEEQKQMPRPIVNEEDRYALGSLNSCFILLTATLDKYAVKIHGHSGEAFTQLVLAKEKLAAGIAVLAVKQGADLSKLPKF